MTTYIRREAPHPGRTIFKNIVYRQKCHLAADKPAWLRLFSRRAIYVERWQIQKYENTKHLHKGQSFI